MLKTAEYDNHEDGLIWVFGSNSNFDFFVRKQALNRARCAPGGRTPPLKDALRKVARDLRARVRTNEDAKIRNADAPPLRLDFTGPFFDNALTSSYSRKG